MKERFFLKFSSPIFLLFILCINYVWNILSYFGNVKEKASCLRNCFYYSNLLAIITE